MCRRIVHIRMQFITIHVKTNIIFKKNMKKKKRETVLIDKNEHSISIPETNKQKLFLFIPNINDLYIFIIKWLMRKMNTIE